MSPAFAGRDSTRQNESSIADQNRVCGEWAPLRGRYVHRCQADAQSSRAEIGPAGAGQCPSPCVAMPGGITTATVAVTTAGRQPRIASVAASSMRAWSHAFARLGDDGARTGAYLLNPCTG